MNRKVVLLMLVCFAAAMLLTVGCVGCSGKKKAAKPDEDKTKASKPEPKPEPKVELEPKPEPKVELEPKPEPKVELEPKPEPKVEPEPKPEPKVEPEPEVKPEPKVEPEPKPEPKTEVGGKVKTAWADAKVGTMVKYKMMNNMTQTMEVTKVDDENVYVNMTMVMGDKEMPPDEIKMPRFVQPGAAKPTDGPKLEIKDLGTETLDVAGQKITCKVQEIKMKVGEKTITSKTWTSDEVPGGMVKSMSDAMGSMQMMMELIEFKK